VAALSLSGELTRKYGGGKNGKKKEQSIGKWARSSSAGEGTGGSRGLQKRGKGVTYSQRRKALAPGKCLFGKRGAAGGLTC